MEFHQFFLNLELGYFLSELAMKYTFCLWERG